MSSYNHAALSGNLTRDPETRTTSGGKRVCEFGLAVSRGRDETDFFDIVCWDKTAEAVQAYLRKGSPALASGSLRQDRWDDKTTGAKRSKVRLTAYQVVFLGGKPEHDTGRDTAPQSAPDAGAPADEESPF